MPPADPPGTDPADQTPRERGLRRRSGGSGLNPAVVVVLLLMLAGLAYVVFAMNA
jgi:hypothetical protein